MSYSSLANYRDMTGNMTRGRGGNKVVYIAIHHMAGCLSVEQCGNVFRTREASAHYGINGKRIGVYVDENNTAWALGNFKRNQQSISIELANSSGSPEWRVADETIETCVKLVADIAYRLGWTYISYTGDMNGDIIMHRWVSSTACPGPYMVNNGKVKYIAEQADKLLKEMRAGKKVTTGSATTTTSDKLVVDGEFGYKSCVKMQKWLKSPYTDGELSGQLANQSKYILNMKWCVDYGSGGSYTVKLLQKKLGVTADGYLGPKTIKALQKFLNNNMNAGLVVDGYAGEKTCKALQTYLNKVA